MSSFSVEFHRKKNELTDKAVFISRWYFQCNTTLNSVDVKKQLKFPVECKLQRIDVSHFVLIGVAETIFLWNLFVRLFHLNDTTRHWTSQTVIDSRMPIFYDCREWRIMVPNNIQCQNQRIAFCLSYVSRDYVFLEFDANEKLATCIAFHENIPASLRIYFQRLRVHPSPILVIRSTIAVFDWLHAALTTVKTFLTFHLSMLNWMLNVDRRSVECCCHRSRALVRENGIPNKIMDIFFSIEKSEKLCWTPPPNTIWSENSKSRNS